MPHDPCPSSALLFTFFFLRPTTEQRTLTPCNNRRFCLNIKTIRIRPFPSTLTCLSVGDVIWYYQYPVTVHGSLTVPEEHHPELPNVRHLVLLNLGRKEKDRSPHVIHAFSHTRGSICYEFESNLLARQLFAKMKRWIQGKRTQKSSTYLSELFMPDKQASLPCKNAIDYSTTLPRFCRSRTILLRPNLATDFLIDQLESISMDVRRSSHTLIEFLHVRDAPEHLPEFIISFQDPTDRTFCFCPFKTHIAAQLYWEVLVDDFSQRSRVRLDESKGWQEAGTDHPWFYQASKNLFNPSTRS